MTQIRGQTRGGTTNIEAYREAELRFLAQHQTPAEPRDLPFRRTATTGHFLVAGSGPPLVLVPGAFFPAVSLQPLIKRLQTRFTVFAVDRPGFGLTTPIVPEPERFDAYCRDFMADVLEALELPRAHLLGCSLGGYACILHALAEPGTTDRMLLLGPPPGIERQVPVPLRILSLPVLGRLLLGTVLRPSVSINRAIFTQDMVSEPDGVPEGFLELLTQAQRLPGAMKTWAGTVRCLASWRGLRPEISLDDRLPKLSVPTGMIWGSEDRVTPPSRGEATMRTIPDLALEVVTRAGHLVHLDAPDRCAQWVEAFLLGGHEPASAPSTPRS